MVTLLPSIATHPILRKPSSPWSGKSMEDNLAILWKIFSVSAAFWGMFMNTTLRAAVHLGKDCDKNLRFVKNHLWKTTGQLFWGTEKLVSAQTETTGVSMINFQDLVWVSTGLLHSRAYHYSTANYVFSDSVLCSGKMGDNPVESWKKQHSMIFGQRLLQRIESNWWTLYGIRVEDFPRIHYSGYPQGDPRIHERATVWTRDNKIEQMMGELQCEREHFKGRIIFMSMFNDIFGMHKEMMNYV